MSNDTARAQKLRQMLETVVADPKVSKRIRKDKNGNTVFTEAAYFDEKNEMYNVVGGRSPRVQAFRVHVRPSRIQGRN